MAAAAVGSIVKPLEADLAYITAEDKKTIEAEISDTRFVSLLTLTAKFWQRRSAGDKSCCADFAPLFHNTSWPFKPNPLFFCFVPCLSH